jgi:hypothetical protein
VLSVTLLEAAAAIGPIVGTGGLAGVLIAALAYLRELRSGGPARGTGPPGTGPAASVDSAAVTALSDAVCRLSDTLARLAVLVERHDSIGREERRAFVDACETVTGLQAVLEDAVLDIRRDFPTDWQDQPAAGHATFPPRGMRSVGE